MITSDRPVVLWNPPSHKDNYRGIGIGDAEEIWFPVDRKRVLILRKVGSERTCRIDPERIDMVNEHIARHCTEKIISYPTASDKLAKVALAKRRPIIRFNQGSLLDETTGTEMHSEIIHSWTPIRDIPDGVEP